MFLDNFHRSDIFMWQSVPVLISVELPPCCGSASGIALQVY